MLNGLNVIGLTILLRLRRFQQKQRLWRGNFIRVFKDNFLREPFSEATRTHSLATVAHATRLSASLCCKIDIKVLHRNATRSRQMCARHRKVCKSRSKQSARWNRKGRGKMIAVADRKRSRNRIRIMRKIIWKIFFLSLSPSLFGWSFIITFYLCFLPFSLFCILFAILSYGLFRKAPGRKRAIFAADIIKSRKYLAILYFYYNNALKGPRKQYNR